MVQGWSHKEIIIMLAKKGIKKQVHDPAQDAATTGDEVANKNDWIKHF